MDITAHKETGITVHQMPNAKRSGLIDMFFKDSLSICVPMQNKPAKRNVLLTIFRKTKTSSDGLRAVFKITARTKKTMKIGNADPFFSDLKYQADKSTKGTIHSVLANFSVVATSTASSPNTEAAPITEAVS